MAKQSKQYDRIFKENIEAAIPGLMEILLGIHAIHSEELPDSLQHTKEREPDVLKKITTVNNESFILQIEFQVVDEPEMIFRMADYYLMLFRKYKLPVVQHVLYLGEKTPAMPLRLQTDRITFSFPLITFSEIDYRIFLASSKSEEVLFALLGNFGNDSPEIAIQRIIDRVEETTTGNFALKRRWVQLRILSQLRNLVVKTGKLMQSISTFFKEENDLLYKKGIEEGIEKGMSKQELEDKKVFSTSLILKTAFDDAKIAGLVGVDVSFVQKLREQVER